MPEDTATATATTEPKKVEKPKAQPLPKVQNPKTFTIARKPSETEAEVEFSFTEGYAKKKGETNDKAKIYPLPPPLPKDHAEQVALINRLIPFYGVQETLQVMLADVRKLSIAAFKKSFTTDGEWVEAKYVKAMQMFSTRTNTVRAIKTEIDNLKTILVGLAEVLVDDAGYKAQLNTWLNLPVETIEDGPDAGTDKNEYIRKYAEVLKEGNHSIGQEAIGDLPKKIRALQEEMSTIQANRKAKEEADEQPVEEAEAEEAEEAVKA